MRNKNCLDCHNIFQVPSTFKSTKKRCISCHDKRIKQQSKKYRDSHPEGQRETHFQRRYKIGLSDYQLMYEKQNGLCSICNQHKTKLFVDHCHKTNKIRKLLCGTCNSGIGMLKDNPEVVLNALFYLMKYHYDKYDVLFVKGKLLGYNRDAHNMLFGNKI